MVVFFLDYLLKRLVKNQLYDCLSECYSMSREISDLKIALARKQADLDLRYAGDKAEAMLQSLESAERFIDDEDPRIRVTALDIILRHWGVSKTLVERCKAIVLEDSDAEVRQVALLCIGRYYDNTDESSVLMLLAKIVGDETAAADVREVAYEQLCRIAGKRKRKRKRGRSSNSFDGGSASA